jgi:protein-disulfide isomerase
MEHSNQNSLIIPLAILVAGGLIAAAIYFGSDTSGAAKPTNNRAALSSETEVNLPPVTDKDHIVGSREAELIVVEYSDTECPFCKTFHNTMRELIQSYEGKVSWVYRHFPIAQLHSKAMKEAEATECAVELGGNLVFWKYLNRMMEITNSNNTLDPSELPKIAGAVGLDINQFNTCLSSGRYTEFINKSVEEAIKAGALGTPYSIILTRDGKKVLINGAEPMAMVKTKIDSLLK